MHKRTLKYCLLIILAISVGKISYAQEEIYKIERTAFSKRSYDEYSPVLYNGDIIFRANRRMSATSKSADKNNKTPMSLLIVRDQGNGEWSEPDFFASELSQQDKHYGPAFLNKDGDRIWFTMDNDESDKDRGKLGIYSADYINGAVTNIEAFQYNDPRYSFMHPFLTDDGSKLYFASDKSGGFGQYDLYVCQKRGGTWSEPVNLGPDINTARHDIYPLLYPNGRLYFASQGHSPNQGGFDIYYCVKVGDGWSPPLHLVPPFNTKRNEAWFYATDTTFTKGYIHSNRERGTYNIYEFSLDIPDSLYEECKIVESNSYCFTFYEAGTMDIDTTQYRYEWVIEDKKFRQNEVDYCFDGVGNYNIALNVIDLLSGEVLFNEATYDLEIENIEQVYISSPDTIFVNDPVRFSGTETFLKDFTIDRYIWDLGDKNWVADTAVDHRYYNPGTYTIKLGVINDAEQPEQVQKTCGFKQVVVLPR